MARLPRLIGRGRALEVLLVGEISTPRWPSVTATPTGSCRTTSSRRRPIASRAARRPSTSWRLPRSKPSSMRSRCPTTRSCRLVYPRSSPQRPDPRPRLGWRRWPHPGSEATVSWNADWASSSRSPQRRPTRTKPRELAEGEREGLNAGIGECDLAGAVGYGTRLADQLVEPLIGNGAIAFGIDVRPVRPAGRLPVDEQPKSYGRARYCRPHDHVQVTGMKAIGDLPISGIERGGLFLHGPVTRESPVVQPQFRREGVGLAHTQSRAAGRREALGARVAGIGFRRSEIGPVGGRFNSVRVDSNRFLANA